MNDEIFFDTNVLAYSFDEADFQKFGKATEIVSGVFEKKSKGVLSNQILFELFLVLTKKLGKPFTKEKATDIVESFIVSNGWRKVNYTHKTVQDALYLAKSHNVSLVDAIIARTAIENDVTKIFTENEKEFSKIPNVKVVNPFKN